MSTQVYEVTFTDGKKCRCIAMEPGTDKENVESIKLGFCGKVRSVKLMKKPPAVQ